MYVVLFSLFQVYDVVVGGDQCLYDFGFGGGVGGGVVQNLFGNCYDDVWVVFVSQESFEFVFQVWMGYCDFYGYGVDVVLLFFGDYLYYMFEIV